MGHALASLGFGESFTMSWRYFVFIALFFDSLKNNVAMSLPLRQAAYGPPAHRVLLAHRPGVVLVDHLR